ncbi:pescadillo-like [Tropilaelaps mercedesae]|uniref:Pescadillo homolog n=1 Tax=Tropilaelaps mercedesae TaxID=418985 RepID=A0A1V9X3V7_9ACAR|nr:pescadillo-like [Tropilaelaps mercedesae]
MGIQKKKGTSGAAIAFVSRGKAIRKLQLSLKDFRRLCILKGIYPVEPKNKTKAGGANKTYYLAKDIKFLAHEPIIKKFREMKIFAKKLRRAIDKKMAERERTIRNNEPTYRLDHIVKERYPTFLDAVRDLDDALSMCFLFATLPKSGLYKSELLQLCRRLTVEFMNYVIESRSLVKCFISIKGFYYQALIQGQPVTWLVPHGFPQSGDDVDARIMSTFTDFYVTLLGFINFKLYNSLNLVYPPQLAIDNIAKHDEELCEGEDPRNEYLEALTASLKGVVKDTGEEATIDDFDDADANNVQKNAEADKNFLGLFSGLRVFLNREVPREPFTFVLRSLGAQVSWDAYSFPGATFNEKDTTITHHIVDRPLVANKVLNRYYIQPQWVFDCVNARRILPVENYFPGSELPPHLSPFVEQKEGGYVPLSREEMQKKVEELKQAAQSDDDQEDLAEENHEDMDTEETVPSHKSESRESRIGFKEQQGAKVKERGGDMIVKKGKSEKIDPAREQARLAAEEHRLAVMMIPKKDKRLFEKIQKKRRIEKREVNKLVKKRDNIIQAKAALKKSGLASRPQQKSR